MFGFLLIGIYIMWNVLCIFFINCRMFIFWNKILFKIVIDILIFFFKKKFILIINCFFDICIDYWLNVVKLDKVCILFIELRC